MKLKTTFAQTKIWVSDEINKKWRASNKTDREKTKHTTGNEMGHHYRHYGRQNRNKGILWTVRYSMWNGLLTIAIHSLYSLRKLKMVTLLAMLTWRSCKITRRIEERHKCECMCSCAQTIFGRNASRDEYPHSHGGIGMPCYKWRKIPGSGSGSGVTHMPGWKQMDQTQSLLEGGRKCSQRRLHLS